MNKSTSEIGILDFIFHNFAQHVLDFIIAFWRLIEFIIVALIILYLLFSRWTKEKKKIIYKFIYIYIYIYTYISVCVCVCCVCVCVCVFVNK